MSLMPSCWKPSSRAHSRMRPASAADCVAAIVCVTGSSQSCSRVAYNLQRRRSLPVVAVTTRVTMPTDLLYTAEQTRLLDTSAIEEASIPGRVLMSRAAAALHRCLVQRWPETDSVHVIAGSGNNGGDGWLLA